VLRAGHQGARDRLGAGADRLAAIGVVDRQSLIRVLEGQDPPTGRELVAPHLRRVLGFDLTFSEPKSVTVLFGLTDERLRSVIRSEHGSAVAEAFGYLERVARGGLEFVRVRPRS
jgi:conjugative relaxase-like TrwC/TraI family protein